MLDQRKTEKVQCRATKMIPQLQDVPYEERLSALSLPSLSHQHFRGDLIMLYKILNGYFNSNLYTPFQPHLPGDAISKCLSINRDYYASQIISLTE